MTSFYLVDVYMKVCNFLQISSSLCFYILNTSDIIPYSAPSSSKRPIVFSPMLEPNLLTESAQHKYDAMKFNFLPKFACQVKENRVGLPSHFL